MARIYSIPSSPWLLLRDEKMSARKKTKILADYFNDVYHLFLCELVQVTRVSKLDVTEEKRLKGLLEELLKVKREIGKK